MAPPVPRPRVWINVGLFILTFFSALLAKVVPEMETESVANLAWRLWREPSLLLSGLPFAIALMAILLAHEMGHYLTARRYRVDQSLPYFIPAPTIFGTLGALILMRAQPPDRRVLLHIAVMGPWAGLVLAIPATIWGLTHSLPWARGPLADSQVVFGGSLLFNWLSHVFGPDTAMVDLHPVAVAGWVGLFVTSLNLIPVGQLDGGHVAYALFGKRQERFSLVVVMMLVGLGLLLGLQHGAIWIFWAMFLFALGLRHPPVRDESCTLTRGQRLHGWLALALFVVTFTPQPIEFIEPAATRPAQEHYHPRAPGSREWPPAPTPAEEFRL